MPNFTPLTLPRGISLTMGAEMTDTTKRAKATKMTTTRGSAGGTLIVDWFSKLLAYATSCV